MIEIVTLSKLNKDSKYVFPNVSPGLILTFWTIWSADLGNLVFMFFAGDLDRT